MRTSRFSGWIGLLLGVFVGGGMGLPRVRGEEASAVEVLRVPGGGVQPQVAVDRDGGLHLVFLGGEPSRSEVWYTRRVHKGTMFGGAVSVGAGEFGGVAMGTVRGAQIVVDATGAPLIVWNGVGEANGHPGSALWWAAGPRGAEISTPRDVIRTTGFLDGGGSVATGRDGEVWAVWQGAPAGSRGETNRGVFISARAAGAADFGPEIRVDSPGDGVCACCGLKALGRGDGTLAVLYRAAGEGGSFRDMTLLLRGPGGEVRRVVLDRWSVNQCPMSTAALAWTPDGLLAAWETRDEVYLAEVDVATGVPTRYPALPATAKRKHPSLATDARGEALLVWVEGTGWGRGGAMGWQRYDRGHRPTGDSGRREGVPVWGSAAAFEAGGRFGVVY